MKREQKQISADKHCAAYAKHNIDIFKMKNNIRNVEVFDFK